MIYKRLKTKIADIGGIKLGGDNPIIAQTMTTTNTMDTEATVRQISQCVKSGAKIVRVTTPSIKDAKNLREIKQHLSEKGINIPLVADIHFTPNAAEIAAEIVEKVRINPGNYSDKKKFELIEYNDETYNNEIEKIWKQFLPLLNICKKNGTALRIGTNHGSLSDRIMSRYGDTSMGMVESALEFLRIARDENFHNIVVSMKASNPQVMIEANLLLVEKMLQEFEELYPIHLGVTEAGDGEDGRVKSAMGISTLLQKGIGDTIRVSLTEDPEFEIPVCKKILDHIQTISNKIGITELKEEKNKFLSFDTSISQKEKPIVISDMRFCADELSFENLENIGYNYSSSLDKWKISDTASDVIIINTKQIISFKLPLQLKVYQEFDPNSPSLTNNFKKYYSNINDFKEVGKKDKDCIVKITIKNSDKELLLLQKFNPRHVMISSEDIALSFYEFTELVEKVRKINNNLSIILNYRSSEMDEEAIMIGSTAAVGELFIQHLVNGIFINHAQKVDLKKSFDRSYNNSQNVEEFFKNVSFSILQASRTRISKTEYISCPSCGRTLFDLQETTNTIRNLTSHLKGVKIAIMGCIVNGPGEMADADFGYVGSGKEKITLYKGKEVVKKNIPTDNALDELVKLLKENDVWVDKHMVD